jgi:hypothetical protein
LQFPVLQSPHEVGNFCPHIFGDVFASGTWIGDKFLFVQALSDIEGLLQQIGSAFCWLPFASLSGQKARAVAL